MTTYRVQNESDGKADSPDGVLEVVEKAGPGYHDIEEAQRGFTSVGFHRTTLGESDPHPGRRRDIRNPPRG